MPSFHRRRPLAQLVMLAALAAPTVPTLGAAAGPAGAASSPAAAPASSRAASAPAAADRPDAASAPAAQRKDVVLDTAPAPATPNALSPLHAAATAAALDDLGLALLRAAGRTAGDAQANAVVSPLSLAVALGMVHAGSGEAGAAEAGRALGDITAGQRLLSQRLPMQLQRLREAATGQGGALTMANRVWLDQGIAAQVPEAYARMVAERFGADGVALPIAREPQAAVRSINAWIAQNTQQRIPKLLSDRALGANSRAVLTSAVYFKGRWAQGFDPAQTQARPFETAPGRSRNVPTLRGDRKVRAATVDGVSVLELPFDGDFALVLAMPPAGHTLDALQSSLEGLDLAAWRSRLQPAQCMVELPRFHIAPSTRSLKTALTDLGLRTPFGPEADLAPLLGRAARGVQLEDMLQSATVTVDEQGAEAAAATAATLSAKSFSLHAPNCRIDRAFMFSIVHTPTGLPLFLGRVSDPGAP